jgi:hypothetical protein
MIFIEARSDDDLAGTDGKMPVPKLELKPLRDAQQDDALFQNYEEAGEQKIRSSFRLPPLFVGRSQDITFASAQTSYEVAEGQVFGPERRQFDALMDLHVLGSYDAKYWGFRSQQAKITDPTAVVDAMRVFDTLGAMTPNIAIALANEYFDLQLEKIDEEWGNWPFEIVKNLAAGGKLEGSQEIERKITINPDGSKTDEDGNLVEAAPPPPGGAFHDPNAKPDEEKGKPPAAKPVATKPTATKPKPAQPTDATKAAVAQALGDLRNILKQNADAQLTSA